jgi:hypothetical protein
MLANQGTYVSNIQPIANYQYPQGYQQGMYGQQQGMYGQQQGMYGQQAYQQNYGRPY